MGSLTQGDPVVVGSAIGQTPEVERNYSNLVPGTVLVSSSPGFGWTVTGAVSAGTLLPYSSAFLPAVLATTNGAAAFLTSDPFYSVVASAKKTLLFDVSVDLGFGQGAGVSPQARVELRWTGGVARNDFIDVDPRNGVLKGSSGFESVQVKGYISQLADGTDLLIWQVIATTNPVPAGTNAGRMRLYPRSDAPTGTAGYAVLGSITVVEGDDISSYVPSFQTQPHNALFGQLPRNAISPRFPQILQTPAGLPNNTGNWDFENATVFVFGAGSGLGIDLNTPLTFANAEGTILTFVNPSGANNYFDCSSDPNALIYGPGWAGGVTRFVMPDGALYPYSSVTLIGDYIGANFYWRMVSNNVGLVNASGVPITPTGQFTYNEVPNGAINGTTGSDGNAAFTLVAAPSPAGSLLLSKNGQMMYPGLAYTLAGNTITYLAPYIPVTGDVHLAHQYIHA